SGEQTAIASGRADVSQANRIGRNVSEEESAVTKSQLVDLGGTENVRFSEREETIKLSVRSREGEVTGRSVRLVYSAVVPEPATRKLIASTLPATVETDRVLIIFDRRDRAELASESG